MSKSLKNFITIRELLKEYTPDHFRLFCLAHRYSSDVEYAPDRMEEARRLQARVEDFLRTAIAFTAAEQIPTTGGAAGSSSGEVRAWKWNRADRELEALLASTRGEVRAALGAPHVHV